MYFHKAEYPLFDGMTDKNIETKVRAYLGQSNSDWFDLVCSKAKSSGRVDGKDFNSGKEYEEFWTREVFPKFKNVKSLGRSDETHLEYYTAEFDGNKVVIARPFSFEDYSDFTFTPNEFATCIDIITRDDFPIKYEDLGTKQFSRRPIMEFGTKQFSNAMKTIRQFSSESQMLVKDFIRLFSDSNDLEYFDFVVNDYDQVIKGNAILSSDSKVVGLGFNAKGRLLVFVDKK